MATITGTAGNDVITGTAAADVLTGRAGNDLLFGLEGADTLAGGAGFDWVAYRDDPAAISLNLGAGQAADGWGDVDTLRSIEGVIGSAYGDFLIGGPGNERFQGRAGNDLIDGGEGQDWLNYGNAPTRVIAELDRNRVVGDGTDQVANIENLRGSPFGDLLVGTEAANLFRGGAGNDTIVGGDGVDTALLAGPQEALTVRDAGGGVYQVIGPEGTDTLVAVEQVRLGAARPVPIASLVTALEQATQTTQLSTPPGSGSAGGAGKGPQGLLAALS